MFILATVILSGCAPFDYGIWHRPIQYKGINNDSDGNTAKDGEPQYKSKWEAQYADGPYTRKEAVEYDSQSTGDDGFSDDGSSDEYCEPVYKFSHPSDYVDIECTRQCYRRRDNCKEDQRMKQENCEHFNAMARIEYGRCLASGAVNCLKGTHECPYPEEEKCEEEYRSCYKSCGGTVKNSCDEKKKQ